MEAFAIITCLWGVTHCQYITPTSQCDEKHGLCSSSVTVRSESVRCKQFTCADSEPFWPQTRSEGLQTLAVFWLERLDAANASTWEQWEQWNARATRVTRFCLDFTSLPEVARCCKRSILKCVKMMGCAKVHLS